MALGVGYLADWIAGHVRLFSTSILMALAVLLQVALWAPGWPNSAISIADGTIGGSSRGAFARARLPEYLRTHYHGGGILIDEVSYNQYILIMTPIPLRTYIGSYSGNLWQQSLQDPTPTVAWVVMRDDPASGDRVTIALRANPAFMHHYRLVYREEGYNVYHRLST